MTYEETLSVLHGWLGLPVVVLVCEGTVPSFIGSASPPVVARLTGVLAHARRLDETWKAALQPRNEERDYDVDDMFFTVGDSDNGFYFRPRLFREAVLLDSKAMWVSLVDTVLDIRTVTEST